MVRTRGSEFGVVAVRTITAACKRRTVLKFCGHRTTYTEATSQLREDSSGWGYHVRMSTRPITPPEPSERPLRRDAERNRRRILTAAREVFADRGLSASLDDIARHAEVGVGTVYRRFPDKQLLIDALFEDRVDEMATVLRVGLEHPDPWSGLAEALETLLTTQAADRGLMEVLLSGIATGERLCGSRERLQPLVAQLLARAQASGAVRADVADTDIPLLQVLIGSLVDATRDVAPDVWRRYLTLFLDGLRAQPDVATPLPSEPVTSEQLEQALAGWRPRR